MSSVLELLNFVNAVDIPNPAPEDPTGGSKGVALILAYIKWGSLIVCGAVGLASCGAMAWGKFSDRPEASHMGRRGLLGAFLGAVATPIVIPALNTVFTAAS